MNNYNLVKIILISLIILLTGCLSLMEEAGRVIDGTVFKEKTITAFRSGLQDDSQNEIEIAVMENRENEKSIIISIKNYPMLKLRGSYPDISGFFQFTSLEYLAGSTHGWNEFSLQVLGTGRVFLGDIKTQQLASLELIGEIEFASIESARIHRYDTRIKGDEALISLRARYDRITSLSEWMLSLNRQKDQVVKDFEKSWKPFLFPEIVTRNNRPENWRDEGDVFFSAEDINWNTSYTERVFPEELVSVRNFGTLLRDWEEALSWIYMFYEWDNIISILSNQSILTKVRS